MQLHHLAIWTTDLERLKDFYITHFSGKASARYENPQKKFSSYFITFEGGASLELMCRPDITETVATELCGLAHFAMGVNSPTDVDNLTRTFEAAGITVVGQPRYTGDGYYKSIVLDPDGNRIELVANKLKQNR